MFDTTLRKLKGWNNESPDVCRKDHNFLPLSPGTTTIIFYWLVIKSLHLSWKFVFLQLWKTELLAKLSIFFLDLRRHSKTKLLSEDVWTMPFFKIWHQQNQLSSIERQLMKERKTSSIMSNPGRVPLTRIKSIGTISPEQECNGNCLTPKTVESVALLTALLLSFR